MRAWHSLSAGSLALVLASAAGAARYDLGPASEEAILAGAKVCVEATTGARGAADPLAGWTAAPKGMFKTDGKALTRDHVLLAVTPGARGACVVTAQAAAGFSGMRMLRDLQHAFGARLRSTTPPVLVLRGGEIMRIDVGSHRDGPTYVHLALVKEKGN